jgi:hypothetical protein
MAPCLMAAPGRPFVHLCSFPPVSVLVEEVYVKPSPRTPPSLADRDWRTMGRKGAASIPLVNLRERVLKPRHVVLAMGISAIPIVTGYCGLQWLCWRAHGLGPVQNGQAWKK